MSQIRKWSSNDSPGNVSPSIARMSSDRGPGQATAYEPRTDVPFAQTTVTPVSSCSTAVTWCPQRTSMRGWSAIRSSSTASDSHCEMFTKGGNGERPRSAKVKLNSSASRWNVRAVVHVTPRRATSVPTPTESQTSRTSRCWQIALLPTRSRSARPSSTTTRRPQRASSSAAVCPTGPQPRTRTGLPGDDGVMAGSALQLVPDLAVPLRRPDHRALDAVELVPQPLHVERQAVLEDRPRAVLRCEGLVGGGEGVLERAAGAVRLADRVLHGEQEVPGLLDGGDDRLPPARDGAAAADQLLGAERLDAVQRAGGPVEVE